MHRRVSSTKCRAYQHTRRKPLSLPATANPRRERRMSVDLSTGRADPKRNSAPQLSDGFGREIQKKLQAEPGPVNGGRAFMVALRWIGSGWTIFNNRGKPVRQYEPFFSASDYFEFAAITRVSPIIFYYPVERVVATLHPNHTYEKVVFDPVAAGALLRAGTSPHPRQSLRPIHTPRRRSRGRRSSGVYPRCRLSTDLVPGGVSMGGKAPRRETPPRRP